MEKRPKNRSLIKKLTLDVEFVHPLTSTETQDKLLSAFHRVFDNLDEVVSYVRKLEYSALWDTLTQLPPKEQVMEFVTEGLDKRFQK